MGEPLRTVYVSMTPTVPHLVDEEEYLDLQRQGLLIPGLGDVPARPAAMPPATPQTVPPTTTAKEVPDGSAEEEPEADRGQDPQTSA
jgi:hypothetical protein